jgi:serine/threonine protein kinase
MPYRDKSDCWALGVICFEVPIVLAHKTLFAPLMSLLSQLPLVLQCATLEHPFEARNQCALIMKIIEAQVKIPTASPITTELRNMILWLLQKDPNTRPSIKDVLNEVSTCPGMLPC